MRVLIVCLLLSGCAPLRDIGRDEALWRGECTSRGGDVVERDGEVYCVREK